MHLFSIVPGSVVVATFMLAACSQTTVAPPAPPAVDPAILSEAQVQAVHQQALVLDAHADIEIPGKPSRYAGDDGLSRVAPDKMRSGGVDAVVMAIAVGPGPRDAEGHAAARALAEEKLAAIQTLVADPANQTVLALDAQAVVAAERQGQRALILGFQNARILGRDVDALDYFYQQGVRVFALTHMGHNGFADASRPVYIGELKRHEPDAEHGGLSELGKAAIRRINALGGVVDLSQLSKQAALQVLAMTTAPVIASHSNVQALSDVRRNLSDEEIDAIGANNGVIHISAFKGYLFDSNNQQLDQDIRAARREANIELDYDYPLELYWEIDDPEIQKTFITRVSTLLGPGSVQVMADHIDYVVKRIGINHVGVGNDFNHGSGIAGYSDATGAITVTRELLKRGYSAADLQKIWGGNFLRVLDAAANR